MNKTTIEKLKTKHYETSVYRSETEAKKESYSFKWGQEIKAATKRIKALEKAIKANDETILIDSSVFNQDELGELLGNFPKIDFPD